MSELVLLKLGGSLITDKTRPYTPRLDVLDDLTQQIKTALQDRPGLRLIVGHGAGSFGHVPASEYRTRDGLPPRATPLAHRQRDETEDHYWKGFAEVWYQAATLNRLVVEAFHRAGIRVLSLSPASSVIASDGKIVNWEMTPLQMALSAGLVPLLHGDVVFDEIRGGTILSTEDLFRHLTLALQPDRILLAGLEEGVWADFPARTRKIERITPASFEEVRVGVGKAAGADVTGGMETKVRQMVELVQDSPAMTVQIFSGAKAGNVTRALKGETVGTLISVGESV